MSINLKSDLNIRITSGENNGENNRVGLREGGAKGKEDPVVAKGKEDMEVKGKGRVFN